MKELFTKAFWNDVKETFEEAQKDSPQTSAPDERQTVTSTGTHMNTEHFKHLLQAKERELLAQIAQLEEQARGSGQSEVRDAIDDATTAQGTSEALEEGSLASQTLIQVRDALQRIENGTYGKCVKCGKPISEARLEAVPWAAYCVEDQEKLDRGAHVQTGGSTL